MSSRTTRNAGILLGLVVSCLIGLPQLYDKFMMARFIAAATGLALVFLFGLFGQGRWRVPFTPIILPYLLFLVLSGSSLIWATNTAEALFAFATLLLGALIIVVIYTWLSTHRLSTQKALWIGAVIILMVYLGFAIIQLAHIESLSFGQLYRVGGINGHKNLLAGMLFVLSAFLLTAFPLFRSKAPKWMAVILFVLSLAVIVLLKSRAVLLSAIVAGVCFGLLLLAHKIRLSRHCERSEANQDSITHQLNRLDCFVPRNDAKRVKNTYRITLIASIVIVYAFLTIGLRWLAHNSVPHTSEKSEVETKMTSTSSLVERCLLWDKTYRIADRHPITGCGIGNWQIHFPDAGLDGLYRADFWNINFTKPHNEYLGILAETGYLGLLLCVVFLVGLDVRAFFALSAAQERRNFLYGAVVLSVFVGSCVNALFDFPNSRIEHLVWTAILMAILLQIITKDKQKTLGWGWSLCFALLALMLVVIGGFRLNGERNTYKMQQALNRNDWKEIKHCCSKAQSIFYTIDPIGLPIHWYQGKAEKNLGQEQALESFRKAYRHAPYCKENLNDLGLAEYHRAHDPAKAERHLKEAIRISPHYLYPYLNLAYIYLGKNEPQKAQKVAGSIDFDEHQREVLKADAVFFEPFNTEAVRRKIDADYEAVLLLRQNVEERMKNENSKKNLQNSGEE